MLQKSNATPRNILRGSDSPKIIDQMSELCCHPTSPEMMIDFWFQVDRLQQLMNEQVVLVT